jgi:hypothetical protein
MTQYQTNCPIGPQGPGNPLQTVGPYGPIKPLASNKDISNIAIRIKGMSGLRLAPLTNQGNPTDNCTESLGIIPQFPLNILPSLDAVEESSDEFALSDYDSDEEEEPTHHWKYIGEELVRDYRAAMTVLPMARPCKSDQSKDGYRAAIEHCLATAEDRFLTRNRDWAKWIVKVEGSNLTPWKRPRSQLKACKECDIQAGVSRTGEFMS